MQNGFHFWRKNKKEKGKEGESKRREDDSETERNGKKRGKVNLLINFFFIVFHSNKCIVYLLPHIEVLN